MEVELKYTLLKKAVVALVEDKPARCGFCGQPMALGCLDRSRPMPNGGKDYSPWYHMPCGEVHTYWAQLYGLGQALRFGYVKKNRKTDAKMKNLKKAYDRAYSEFVSWYETHFGSLE